MTVNNGFVKYCEASVYSSDILRLISLSFLVESNCCMTPKKLQESVLWHFYVLLGP